MQDTRWPIQPPDISLLRQLQRRRHATLDLHRGWCAARAGMPLDGAETDAWQTGWRMWRQQQRERIEAQVRQLWAAHAQMARTPAARPKLRLVSST